MAGTIKAYVSHRWIPSSGDEFPFPDDPTEKIISTTGDNSLMHDMDLTTTQTAIVLGSVATGGILVVKNPNASGDVLLDLGAGSVSAALIIPPGETHMFRFHSAITAPRAYMSAGTGRMRYRITDN